MNYVKTGHSPNSIGRPFKKGQKARLNCPHTEETKRKIGLANKGKLSGKNHPNWNGGNTSLRLLIYVSPEYKKWRYSVFERDGFSCISCCLNYERLNAHHIKPFVQILGENKIKSIEQAKMCKELWNVNNGITLCEKCHKQITIKRGDNNGWKNRCNKTITA